MGLDTTHGCWHGAYSRFGKWREAVAKAAGIDDWTKMNPDPTNDELFGRWKKGPADPLMVLWSHSDCDGVIQTDQCIPLAEALLKLAPDMRNEERENTLRFASGLLLAASRNEDVEFC